MEILTKAGSIHTSLLLQVPAPHLETPMLGMWLGACPTAQGARAALAAARRLFPLRHFCHGTVSQAAGGDVFFSQRLCSLSAVQIGGYLFQ